MAAIVCKPEVNTAALEHQQLGFIVGFVAGMLAAWGQQNVVTSLNDGNHMHGSLHYSDLAVDIRTHHLPPDIKRKLVEQLKYWLDGNGYDFVLEAAGQANEHLHCEAQLHGSEQFIARSL